MNPRSLQTRFQNQIEGIFSGNPQKEELIYRLSLYRMTLLRLELLLFYNNCSFFPSSKEGLSLLQEKSLLKKKCRQAPIKFTPKATNENFPFFDKWKRPIFYSQWKSKTVLISLGADGKVGGDGFNRDIVLIDNIFRNVKIIDPFALQKSLDKSTRAGLPTL